MERPLSKRLHTSPTKRFRSDIKDGSEILRNKAKCARLLQPKFGSVKGIAEYVKVTKNSKSTKGEKPFTPSIIELSRAKDGKVREDVADF